MAGVRFLKNSARLIGLCCLFAVASARASAPQFLVYTEHLPPLQYVDSDGQVSGFSVDVMSMVLEQMDIQSPIEALPWKEAYRIALNEPNVVLFSLIKTPQRESLFHWVGTTFDDAHPLFLDSRGASTDMMAWVLEGSALKVSSLQELVNLSTCAARHDVLSEHLGVHLNWPEELVTYTDTWSQAWEMFFAGRCKVILGREAFVTEYLRGNLRSFTDVKPLFSVQSYIPWPDYYFALSKHTDSRWVSGFRRALEQVKSHPDYTRHYRKWRHLLQLPE